MDQPGTEQPRGPMRATEADSGMAKLPQVEPVQRAAGIPPHPRTLVGPSWWLRRCLPVAFLMTVSCDAASPSPAAGTEKGLWLLSFLNVGLGAKRPPELGMLSPSSVSFWLLLVVHIEINLRCLTFPVSWTSSQSILNA